MSIEQTILKANLDYIRPALPEEKAKKDSFVFLLFSMISILGIDIEEALKCITDGADDNAQDGIYIELNETDIIIHFFQSKYRINDNSINKPIGKKDIDLTLHYINNILKGNEIERSSPFFQRKLQEIRDVISEYGRIKLPVIKVYFVTNGAKSSEHDKEQVKIFESEANRSVSFLTTTDILQVLDSSSKEKVEVNITTKGNMIQQDFMGDVRGVLCTINSKQLVELYDKCGRDRLLDKNIRFFLGNNSINKKIKETAESIVDSKYFWFYNNGISIVCDKFTPSDDTMGNKIIRITNPKIVNGGQTTKTLFELSKKTDSNFSTNTINDVFLLARIYETDKPDLIDKITQGTNNQNPTIIRDLRSNDPVQNMVKEYFKLKGFYLETKRNEYREKKIEFDKIVKNDSVFQSYLSLYSDIPHQAKSGKSKAFEDYFKNVFNSNNSKLPEDFYRSFEILHFVNEQEKLYDTENGYSYLLHATFSIIYALGKYYDICKDTSKLLNKVELTEKYKEVLKIVEAAIKKEQSTLEDEYSHNRFFKSSNSKIIIDELIKSKKQEAKLF